MAHLAYMNGQGNVKQQLKLMKKTFNIDSACIARIILIRRRRLNAQIDETQMKIDVRRRKVFDTI